MTQPSKIDKLVSIDVARRFEALQDEVDLLKHEVKQTLVDLRGFMMETRTVLPQATITARLAAPPKIPASTELDTQPIHFPAAGPAPQPGTASSRLPRVTGEVNRGFEGAGGGFDPAMLGEVIRWLATVKHRGLSLHQITPYLEAYEKAGYLGPVMVKIILLSMADLDQRVEAPPDPELSPEEYFECVREFHEIVCTNPCSSGPSWATTDLEQWEMAGTLADPGTQRTYSAAGSGDRTPTHLQEIRGVGAHGRLTGRINRPIFLSIGRYVG